jgi:hypothetical protein
MACTFSIEFPLDVKHVVKKAESAIVGAGGDFAGDDIAGNFSLSLGIGSVSGEYTVQNQNMNIRIHNKPVLVGCGMIEREIRKYLVQENS